MRRLALAVAVVWTGLWLTPDQQGRRHFERGEFAEAARDFRDPQWRGAALYRAGEFAAAEREFARRDSAEAHYNRGNACLMGGRYEAAVACYDHALAMRPGWTEAAENRALAAARARALESGDGDATGGPADADEVVFDGKTGPAGGTAEVAGGGALTDQEIQALWLRRVRTRPADFLRAKFAHQQALRAQGGGR